MYLLATAWSSFVVRYTVFCYVDVGAADRPRFLFSVCGCTISFTDARMCVRRVQCWNHENNTG